MGSSSSIAKPRAWAKPAAEQRPQQHVVALRAQGPALQALAQARHIPLARLTRQALAEWLAMQGDADSHELAPSSEAAEPGSPDSRTVRLCLSFPEESATQLTREARAAAMGRGRYVARLLKGTPPMAAPVDMQEDRSALTRSTATLAALCSDLLALEQILKQGHWEGSATCAATLRAPIEALMEFLPHASSYLASLSAHRSLARDTTAA